MKILVKLGVIVSALGAFLLLVAPSANAEAYRSQDDCGSWGKSYHTNRWDYFSGHHMDVALGTCTNGTKIFWGKNPQISFPTRNIVTGALEDLDVVSGPTIYSKGYCPGINGEVVCRVTWKYSVKQSVSMTPMAQTFDFKVSIYPAGSRICSGGTCDDLKYW